jgi:hypothetical protein
MIAALGNLCLGVPMLDGVRFGIHKAIYQFPSLDPELSTIACSHA